MNKSKNTFLKSKMNKDIDARILPNNEYRNAVNVQVNKSEGSNVGSLENVLGNAKAADVAAHTGISNLECIGTLQDESTGIAYLFFTDNTDGIYRPTGQYSNHFIISFNSSNSSLITLVQGPFLNFSTLTPVYGSNIIENLLFWTDNRNQPRKINVDFANTNTNQPPTYYTTEDQISVAKYNPHDCIEMYAESKLSTAVTTQYESTMKDVSSKNLPNGGNGELNISVSGGTQIIVKNFVGDIQVPGATTYDSGSSVFYIDGSSIVQPIASAVVSAATYDSGTSLWTINITGAVFPALSSNTTIILNANPYYDSKFAGDPTYLDDKFVRFGYRFKFDDNEYSLFSTFTQAAFIPKQDGYFMYVQKDDLKKINNESEASRSTIVNFVENKVDQIKLRIPLPFKNYNLRDSLKVTEIDILYKESDQIPVKVIDTISESDIYNASASCLVKTATVGAQTTVAVDNIVGGIQIGSSVTGFGITTNVTVVAYNPDNPNVNPSTVGTIALSSAQTLAENVELTIGEPNYYVYDYQSKKPFRTLPEKDLIRVFDKTPIRALAQEISGNRVIYGNYLNKYTAPEFINYNLAITDKSAFSLNGGTAQISGTFPAGSTTITLGSVKGEFLIGMIVICDGVAPGTLITGITGSGTFNITLDTPTTGVLVNLQLVVLEPGGTEQNTTSRIEYPNSSLKTNRNYQVGIVLSDRYGRQSGVILSNNKEVSVSGTQTFIGSTIYSPYNTPSTSPSTWPGDSIKLIFNNQIATEYNGDVTSPKYNPLGWYSYKIVVKQTEQEYYNVYLPGIMAGYPENLTLEQGQTSHVVLTSDNINKIPRDLNEVGPTQDQFRSSVKLYGRVENSSVAITPSNFGLSNLQYYPGREFDIAITISPMNDLFSYNPISPPEPNFFPQFYTYDSNPYIARLSTASKIGQIANVNYTAVSAFIAVSQTTATLLIYNVSGDVADIEIGDSVTGPGFPEDLVTIGPTPYQGPGTGVNGITAAGSSSTVIEFGPNFGTGITQVFIGDVVSNPSGQSGVADGTVITDIILGSTNPTVNTQIIVNQTAVVTTGQTIVFTRPARITVSETIVVSQGDRINISSVTKPGLQYLAVYETEPVQSLLDIFWESSTTGIIQDINNIILNENTGGVAAGSLAPFNTDPFKEDLRKNPVSGEYPTITTAPFGLVDNFEQPITLGAGDTPLSLDRVENGYGDDVQTIYINNDVGVTPYITPCFSFAEVGSSGLFNIRIAEGFTRNIYFGDDDLLHTFTFFFSATVNGLETFFDREVVLRNVAPAFYTWEGTSFNALRTQSSVTDIQVYSAVAANSVNTGWKVINATNPSAFPSLLSVAGTGYTIGTSTSGIVGAPNNISFFSFRPTLDGIEQSGNTINLEGLTQSPIPGSATNIIEIGNTVAFNSEVDIDPTSNIPAGTYVTGFTEGVPGTITFSNSITTTGNSGNIYTGGDRIFVYTPNFLKVSAAVSVTQGDLIYAYQAPAWNNCPIEPFYPGTANVEVIGKLQGVNGAGFDANDLFSTNQNNKKWRDLYMEITSVTNSAGEPADSYFGLSNNGALVGNDGLGVGPGGLQAIATVGEVNLLNLGASDEGMPADVYTLNLKLSDPGDFVECQVQVNTGLRLCTSYPAVAPAPPGGRYGDGPVGINEYTVTASPNRAGLPVLTWKYIVVVICEGAAGVDSSFGGNSANGIYVWSAGGGTTGSIAGEGFTSGNSSWENCIAQSGAGESGNLQLPTVSGIGGTVTGQINPNVSNCESNWAKGYAWDDIGNYLDPTVELLPGFRTELLLMPCCDLNVGLGQGGSGNNNYSTTIVKTAGVGTGLPLNPPVANYVFTL